MHFQFVALKQHKLYCFNLVTYSSFCLYNLLCTNKLKQAPLLLSVSFLENPIIIFDVVSLCVYHIVAGSTTIDVQSGPMVVQFCPTRGKIHVALYVAVMLQVRLLASIASAALVLYKKKMTRCAQKVHNHTQKRTGKFGKAFICVLTITNSTIEPYKLKFKMKSHIVQCNTVTLTLFKWVKELAKV